MSATTLPQVNCPCCGHPLTVYQPWKAIMAECRNRDCNPVNPSLSRYLVTDELAVLLAMTDEQIAIINGGSGAHYTDLPAR